MKLIKSLLLGSAASLSTIVGAQAADLPSLKAAPVAYVRICDAYGAGFFYIPGTDTCIKVGGLVYGEQRALTNNYQLGSSNPGSTVYANGTAVGSTGGSFTNAKARDTTGFSALGRVELDARTATGYGTVRTFLRVDAFYGSGANASTGSNFAIPNTFNTGQGTQGARETTIVNKAFIQFAGLTAGRAQSVFDFYADAYNYASLRGSNATTELLSYTYTFGSGFSGTISIEDNGARRAAIGSTVVTTGFTPLSNGLLSTAAAGTAFQALPQGNRVPEIVGNLRYDAPWGAVQLSGALHQVEAGLYGVTALTSATGGAVTGAAVAANPNLGGNFAAKSSEYFGGAVQLGLMYNTDFIAAGDKAWVQAAYENAAYGYISGNNLASSYGPVDGNRFAGDAFTAMDNSVYWNGNPGYDCVFTGSGNCDRQYGWAVTAAYKHYWMPTLSSAFYGSHLETFYSNAAYNGFSGFAAGAAVNGAVGVMAPKESRVGANLVWTPVKGFDIGVEGMWIHTSQNRPAGLATDAALVAAGLPAYKYTQDEGEARLRVQRAF